MWHHILTIFAVGEIKKTPENKDEAGNTIFLYVTQQRENKPNQSYST